MRIIVPIKQVPETNAVRMDEATGTMIREGVEAILNPLDLYAVEAAVRIRERQGGEVIALTMGPAGAAAALREALSMGADSAVLISDRALAGADTWATGHTLAAAIRRIGAFDLILCGERATDGDTGQVGPALAAFLDLPVATYVSSIRNVAERNIVVTRLIESGCETLDIRLPALITVVKAAADPRLPTLSGKRKARAAEIPIWAAADLGLSHDRVGLKGSPTRVVRVFHPKLVRDCEKVVAHDEESAAVAVERLVAFLESRNLV